MAVIFEFLLVAGLIYLWESTLWLPKQGVGLRLGFFTGKWRVISATRLLATRELGVVLMLPLPPDTGLAPAAEFPLIANTEGKIFIATPDGIFREVVVNSWDDIRFSEHRLRIGEHSIRCQSPRAIELLQRGKKHGLPPAEAIRRSWRISLSPTRANREMKRWKISSFPLRFYCPALTLGFFAGLPLAYLYLGPLSALWIGAWLWILMFSISLQLFRLAKHHFPAARAELRMDAFLSLIIPFHAMRALELASVHAYACTHPAAILLASCQTDHAWFRKFIRETVKPRPPYPGDTALRDSVTPVLEDILAKQSLGVSSFLAPPDKSGDPEASSWCPRCHGLFMPGVSACKDCGGLPLKNFD